MKRTSKGEYAWLSFCKKRETIRTIVYFGISGAIFLMGYLSAKTTANLLTVVAALGCLPASKSAVSMIMFLRATVCGSAMYESLCSCFGADFGYYHLYFTGCQKNHEIHHLYIKGSTVAAYSENPGIDQEAAKDHLLSMLRQAGVSQVSIKIFRDSEEYLARLRRMTLLEPDPAKDEKIRECFFAVTL